MTTLEILSARPWLCEIAADDGGVLTPVLQIEPGARRCWLEGQERDFDEIAGAQNGDGSYRLTAIPAGLGTNDGSGFTVALDYNFPANYTAANKPSGHLFSWVNAAQNNARFEVFTAQTVNEATAAPGGVHVIGAYVQANAAFNNGGGGSILNPSGQAVLRSEGVRRQIFTVPVSGPVRGQQDCGLQHNFGNVTATVAAPTRIEIGRRALDGLQPLVNCTVRRVIVFNRDLSPTEQDRLAEWNEYGARPVLWLGDSINNAGAPMAAARLAAMADGMGYLPMHSDGQGGRGLHYFRDMAAALIAAHPRFANHALCLIEALDFQSENYPWPNGATVHYTQQDIIRIVGEIAAKFKGRFLMMVPHTNSVSVTRATNPVAYDKHIVALGNLRHTYPDALVDWEGLVQARAADDASYAALRAAEQMPASLMLDAIHLAWWTAAGQPGAYRELGLAFWRKLKP